MKGGKAILAPVYSPEMATNVIRCKQPDLIAGVPSLYRQGLVHNPLLKKAGLACLRAAYCSGGRLPRAVKERFSAAVRAQGGQAKLGDGYSLTEAAGAAMAMPLGEDREGSAACPFPIC